MSERVYVDVPREFLSLVDELDLTLAGPTRGALTDIAASIGVAGGALGATADVVTVLIGRSEVARLARRLWSRTPKSGEQRKIVLEVRQGSDRLDVSFQVSGPGTEQAQEVFVRGFAAAFSAMLEKHDDDR
ncbi:hypothetical protein AB0M20_24400 [Actinoplanes sp. NPDC051633]|uniref:hypothetical protein n=1 Tax=Actinoplanes sp. NPDC051633 TaxID=3155670 RepID=UPI0034350343